jgi:hypothetical protein
MLYDLDPVPEDNTKKPEVKDYVDVKKQAAKHGHLNPATRVCLPHLLNRYFISPDMVIISVQCSVCRGLWKRHHIAGSIHRKTLLSNGHIIFLYVALVSYSFDKKSWFTRLGKMANGRI